MSADPIPPIPPAARVAPTEHDALPAGTRFGEFEIIRVLGVGGFGIVYLAQDHSLERQVALKEYMPASLAARGAGAMVTIRSGAFAETYAMGLRSFINEARLLARFDHPSLVKVYRFWEDNGTAYMVMPYLQGRTLRDVRRAMDPVPDEAWIRSVLDPLLDALDLLHREGVYHRDIAPDNILLPPEGAPILLDFGAARRVISDRTQSLTAILKPSYAPIEQYAEMAAMRQGPWTDLYALGAVLHYLLFGVPPSPATARAVEPDAEQIEQRIVPGVSPRFMRVVAWMLGVRPLDRPQNVASVRAAINGQLPIPASVRHGVTVPGDTALAPRASASAAPPGFAPTQVETPFEPTLRLDGSADAAARLDTPHPPAASITPPLSMPAAASVASGPAPMRSTPPGTPPPSYVPPPRPQRPATEAAPVARAPRRGLMLAAGLAALALAAGVLWQFVGVIGRQRPVTAAPLAAARAAPDGFAGPTVAQVASVPQWGHDGALAAASAPVPPTVVVAVGEAASGGAPAIDRVRPRPVAVRASEALVRGRPQSVPDDPRPRAAAIRLAPDAGRGEPVLATGPASVREACGDRHFIALAICIDRQCERPRFRETPECTRVLEAKRRRDER